MDQTKNKKAFTLVELVITVWILAVLMTLWAVSYVWYTKDARDFKRVSDITLLKSSTLVYKKANGNFPEINTNSWIVYSWSLANKISKQADITQDFLATLWITQKLKDPSWDGYYVYSLSNDKLFFQYAATLEGDKTQVAYQPFVQNTYAAYECGKLKAYVGWNFVPTNLNVLPGLVYAFDYRKTNLDISTTTNLKKVVLNDQKINIAYDYTNTPQTCAGDVLTTTIGTSTGASLIGASCVNSKGQTIPNGSNEVIDMTGTTLNSKIGWKYKVCNNGVMDKNGVAATTDTDYYYVCKDIGAGAVFDSLCRWTGCSAWYTVDTWTPGCIADVSTVTLAGPQNGSYQLPISWNLSWYHVKEIASGSYKVYLGTTNSTFEVINGVVTMDNFMPFDSLTPGKMYFWKVQFCDNLARCKDSSIYSFSTSSNSSTPTATGGTAVATTYCPPGIVCRVDDVSISYVGCSPWSSAYSDCKKDNFGTSEKNGSDYFWVSKSIGYKILNNSDGIAKFNIELWKTAFTLKGSASSYDDTYAVNVNGNNLWNNFYWNAGDGCLWNAVSGYSISAKSACYINFYFRGDPLISTVEQNVQKVNIINTDKTNGDWADTMLSFSGKTSGYNSSNLTLTMSTTKYKSALEPTANTTVVNDFDTSTLDGASKWYWKALVYTITNPNTSETYFKPMFTDDYGEYSISPVNSTGGTDGDFSIPLKNIDIWLNGVGNFYYNNGDFSGASLCVNYKNGFKVLASSSCKITMFFRADPAILPARDNVLDFQLAYQPVANPATIPIIDLYAKKTWGNTTLFTGYFPYSYNGRWLDFSTFQLTWDLTPSGFIRSQTMGWIDMSGSETWSTIKVYYDGTKKRIKGKTYWQTAGWVDFNKNNDPNTQTYIDAAWKMHGWARSQNYWWISFDNGVGQ